MVQPVLSDFDDARAWQLLQLHRPELALAIAQQRLANNAQDIPAILIQTEALCQLNQLEQAVEWAQRAVALAPQLAVAHFALAQAHSKNENFHSARYAALEAVRLAPVNAGYLGFLAYLHYQHIDLAAAIAVARMGLAIDAQHADCLLWLMMACEDKRQFKEADNVLLQLLQVAPDSGAVQANVGSVLLRRGEPAAAATHLLEAMRLDPGSNLALLPYLRQARRWQSWPAWLVRWGVPVTAARLPVHFFAWWVRLLLLPLISAYTIRSWGLLQQDALVAYHQEGARQQRQMRRRYPWASTWWAWALLFLLIIGSVYFFSSVFNLDIGLNFLLLYFVARYFMKLEKPK